MRRHRVLSGVLSVLAMGAIAGVGCASTTDPNSTNPPPPPPPPPPPAAAQMTLQTTLDGPSAVAAPSIGTGGGIVTTTPANDFVAARVGDGLRTDAVGERVRFPQISGGVQNLENESGTLQFWYQPTYDHDIDQKYTIAGTGTWKANNATAGSIHFGKHNGSNQSDIFLIFFDANSVRWEHNVAANAYSWNAGEWHLFRITWDVNVAAGERNLHLYIDGQELPLTGEVSRGPQTTLPERSNEFIYIGARDVTGNIIAGGVYDDVEIWNTAIPPS